MFFLQIAAGLPSHRRITLLCYFSLTIKHCLDNYNTIIWKIYSSSKYCWVFICLETGNLRVSQARLPFIFKTMTKSLTTPWELFFGFHRASAHRQKRLLWIDTCSNPESKTPIHSESVHEANKYHNCHTCHSLLYLSFNEVHRSPGKRGENHLQCGNAPGSSRIYRGKQDRHS